MIQGQKEFVQSVCDYNQFTQDHKGQIQKIYSTGHFLVLYTYFPGGGKSLYLGRGSHFEGFWPHDFLPSPEYRGIDRFLEFVRKQLTGVKVGHFQYSEEQRILVIPYVQSGVEKWFGFYWKGRELHFATAEKKVDVVEVWHSTEGKKTCRESSFIAIKEMFGESKQIQIENKSVSIADYLKALSEIDKNAKQSVQKERSLTRKLNNIKQDLARIEKFIQLKPKLIEDQVSFDGEKFEYEKIKVKFLNSDSHFQRRKLVFDKMKNLAQAQILLQSRLKETEQEIQNKNQTKNVAKKVIAFLKPCWGENKAIQQTKEDGILKLKMAGMTLLVGMNARANDQIRKMSNKEDYWFHLEGHTGSHAILKTDDMGKFFPHLIGEIGSLLRDYSKVEALEIPLIFTQVKNLKAIKGHAGLVEFKKEKHVKVQYVPEWKSRLE